MSELLQPQNPFMGEHQWIRSCKPAIGNTFTKFYLKDLTGQDQKEGYHLGSFVAAHAAGHASFQLTPGKKTGGALLREPPRRGVSESSDTIERVLQPFKVTLLNSFLVLYLLFLSCILCYQEYILVPIILRM